MAVMARDTWTDGRLDDLNHRVDEGFTDMRDEFRAVRSETQAEFASVRAELREMRAEMEASRRTTVQAAAAIWVTSMVGFLGVIATIVAST